MYRERRNYSRHYVDVEKLVDVCLLIGKTDSSDHDEIARLVEERDRLVRRLDRNSREPNPCQVRMVKDRSTFLNDESFILRTWYAMCKCGFEWGCKNMADAHAIIRLHIKWHQDNPNTTWRYFDHTEDDDLDDDYVDPWKENWPE